MADECVVERSVAVAAPPVVVDGEHVAIDLVFEKPFRSESITTFAFRPAAEGANAVE